ncbi:MAG: hypothetical protein UR28_C0036G0005 [Candidatus Peregrinibacteria bacterium GW2011_GWF2_33_10]|nr:MAG: hypothetical protein UR28_C0036G0005 [Candidatus Peregrinibacteria bacterium GW2011_GWF2_33_10]OGJ43945.1 MAG: hypothetical protein A2272_04950 [Candidatus Peregrinibacteria bacterium RIFOXYA12_FULL_33_12]OGJ46026.1 MAG: hypothetical protein A2263_03345 [Candidatus Peregrinibacteria bacterium RIFOXYA2_FULL_33_21]OGJ51731.1 MAG: hypothetical protein A2307_04375 [Candidatus Peregrinibacteria bacterium RIFOXYB2_FULL_33_20]
MKTKTATQKSNNFKIKSIYFDDQATTELKRKHQAAENYANKILYGMKSLDDEINLNVTIDDSDYNNDDDDDNDYHEEDWN